MLWLLYVGTLLRMGRQALHARGRVLLMHRKSIPNVCVCAAVPIPNPLHSPTHFAPQHLMRPAPLPPLPAPCVLVPPALPGRWLCPHRTLRL